MSLSHLPLDLDQQEAYVAVGQHPSTTPTPSPKMNIASATTTAVNPSTSTLASLSSCHRVGFSLSPRRGDIDCNGCSLSWLPFRSPVASLLAGGWTDACPPSTRCRQKAPQMRQPAALKDPRFDTVPRILTARSLGFEIRRGHASSASVQSRSVDAQSASASAVIAVRTESRGHINCSL